ncbi:hypothetical protein ACJJTC_004914 [Scirpophaga incertulas]
MRIPYILLLLIWTQDAVLARKRAKCPIGFQLATSKEDNEMCYRLKGPETFYDIFEGCSGNLYTSKLYYRLKISKTNKVLWTEYQTAYPGGPFVEKSFTDSSWEVLQTSFDISYVDPNVLDEACVVVDPVSNFTAAGCNSKFYRYCFVKPYEDEPQSTGCSDLQGSIRFFSPNPICLTSVTGVGNGTVRATWHQAREMCLKRGGSLLKEGWRYANNPILHATRSNATYPLGIVKNNSSGDELHNAFGLKENLPKENWNFKGSVSFGYGALYEDFWGLVNSTAIFFDVICEKPPSLDHIDIKLAVDRDKKLVLSVSQPVEKSAIECYKDVGTYFVASTSVSASHGNKKFRVHNEDDGLYECSIYDFKKFSRPYTSNQVLSIRSKNLKNLYAVGISWSKHYSFENIKHLIKVWKKKLEMYIFYSTKYISLNGEIRAADDNETEYILKEFMRNHSGLQWNDSDVITDFKVMRLYLDQKSVLLHLTLEPYMLPVSPGTWDELEVVFMKPAYLCKSLATVPISKLGDEVRRGCVLYKCIGDYISGVQWLESGIAGCSSSTQIIQEYSIETEDNLSNTTNKWNSGEDWSSSQEDSREQSVDSTAYSTDDTVNAKLTFTTDKTTNETSQVITVTTPPMSTVTIELGTTVTVPDPVTVPNVQTTEAVATLVTTDDSDDDSSEESESEPYPTTTLPPVEQLQQVLVGLEQLLQAETLPIEEISKPFDEVNDVLELREQGLEIPGELLRLLDRLAAHVQLGAAGRGAAVRPNVALLLADAAPRSPVRGLRVAARDTDAFDDNSFQFIDDELDPDSVLSNQTEALVYLPESVTRSERRVSFVAFRTQAAFPSELFVNSRVFSVNVENLTQFDRNEVIDIYLKPLVEVPDRNLSRTCAYWEFNETGGHWSTDGCRLVRGDDNRLDICRCTHLTHFAEVLVPRTVFSEAHEATLEGVSVVGSFLSLFGLAAVAVTAALFRSWRREYSNKVWLQLCVAIFVMDISFVVVVFAKFPSYDLGCMLVGVALHYSVLASFCWMLVAAVLSYRRLVLVFTRDMSHKLLRAAAFSWGTPCAVIGILLSVDPMSYAGQYQDITPSGAFCYPTGLGLWLALYTPIGIMLLINWVLFVLILRSVFGSRNIQRHGDTNEAFRCASVSCLLVFLFGLPWVFGLFSFNIVAAYIFTLATTCQGFVLFIFFVVANKKTRDLWLNKLKIKQTRKIPVTSSTYTNRSIGWRGGADVTPSSIEVRTSKPRSLSSPDDSRFS